MKVKSIIASLLLIVASMQTAWAQKVVLNKTDGSYISCDVSDMKSIDFYEIGSWLVKKIELSETYFLLKPDEMKILTATVFPEDADNKDVTWESSDEDVAEVTKNGKVITNNSGICTITCSAKDGSGVTATCEVHVMAAGTYGTTNGHEWVDLGLPSGTKWATCNVGANNPEEYGNYYAWGETETKDVYNWGTYKYCNGSQYTLTKYCTLSKYGTVDNKTELVAADDAATVNWGSGWQMPSIEQLEELSDSSYTTMEDAKQNGVWGWLIKSKSNNNSIFLPYAGIIYSGLLGLYVEGGGYWSRSLKESHNEFAQQIAIGLGISWARRVAVIARLHDLSIRCYGWSVRPVRKK